MANEKPSKVVLGNRTLIDLTEDTVTEQKVLAGYTFHRPDGETASGTCDFTVDASGATAAASEVLAGKTFARGSAVLPGEMPNIGAQTGSISTKAGSVSILQGYHDGSGSIGIDATEQAKIIAGNIKAGVEILGVEGDYSGEAVHATTATATPTLSQQTILPPSGYDYLSQVTVNAIEVTETVNASGGLTVVIAPVA